MGEVNRAHGEGGGGEVNRTHRHQGRVRGEVGRLIGHIDTRAG